MSLEFVKKSIMKFIAHDLPEIMVVKGDWGVGKTYCWNACLNNAINENKLSLQKYSYVSLFGINSIDGLKNSIFENVIYKSQFRQGANIDTFIENSSKNLLKLGRSNSAAFKTLPFVKSFTPMLERMSFISLKDTVICIDDLERRGRGLSVTDVLGLSSMLKEQRKCKVVLLLNENELRKSELRKYKEKVIDYEVEFHPTSEECISLAFGKNTPEELKKYANDLQINNIRVLKKIELLYAMADIHMSNLRMALRSEVMHSLVLFAWCYYCSDADKKIPTLEFIRDKRFDLDAYGGSKNEDPIHVEWNTLLMSYKYYHTSDLDLIISDAIKSGYFDNDSFIKALTERNEEIIRGESSNSFTKAWDKYHNSFTIGQDEVVDTLYESFMSNSKYIAARNLNSTVKLMKSLGENEKAIKLIDEYIKVNSSNLDKFDVKEVNHFGDINDPDILERFRFIYEKNKEKENAKDVLSRIAGRNGWHPDDIDILSNTSSDEYYSLFTSDLGENLASFVSTCLKFGGFDSGGEKYKVISENAKEALYRIASKNELNRLRVLRFGIDFSGL